MALALGFLIDLLIGDPHWLYHPVRLIGALIAKTEKKCSEWFPKTDTGQLSAGILLVVVVVLVSTFVPWLLLFLSGKVSIYFKFFLMTVMSYQLLATKGRFRRSKICGFYDCRT